MQEDSSVFAYEGEKKKNKKPIKINYRLISVIAGSILIFTGVAILISYIINRPAPVPDPTVNDEVISAIFPRLNSAKEEEYNSLLTEIDSYLDSENIEEGTEVSRLYRAKSIIYGKQGKFEEALRQLLEAEKIASQDTKYNIYAEIANYYSTAGDKQNEIVYIEKLIQVADESDPGQQSMQNHYKARVDQLKKEIDDVSDKKN
jgi:hypothetical protein